MFGGLAPIAGIDSDLPKESNRRGIAEQIRAAGMAEASRGRVRLRMPVWRASAEQVVCKILSVRNQVTLKAIVGK